jgi:hypothetical protein
MKHLGDYTISKEAFPKLDLVLKELKAASHPSLQEKITSVSQMLLRLIQEAPEGHFLLVPILDFIEKVHLEKILDHYHFNNFELWLNQFSGLSPEENYAVRGKIAGR